MTLIYHAVEPTTSSSLARCSGCPMVVAVVLGRLPSLILSINMTAFLPSPHRASCACMPAPHHRASATQRPAISGAAAARPVCHPPRARMATSARCAALALALASRLVDARLRALSALPTVCGAPPTLARARSSNLLTVCCRTVAAALAAAGGGHNHHDAATMQATAAVGSVRH